MKSTSLLLLPFSLLTAYATETPQFSVSCVQFVPPPPAGEKPYLREDEESGEPAPQLTIKATAKLDRKEFFITPIDETLNPTISEEKFKGYLIATDGKVEAVSFFAVSEDDESITIYIECQSISKIHTVYTLKGTLEFNASYEKDGIYHGRLNRRDINQKIHLLGK